MKRWMWSMLLAGVLSAGLSAQKGTDGSDSLPKKDGTTVDEEQAAVEARFKKVDADGDGKITKAEYKASVGDDAEAFDLWYEHYIGFCAMDTDADNALTMDEFKSGNSDDFEQHLGDKQIANVVAEIYSLLDADKDGNLTKAELDKADDDGVDEDEFKEYDTNGDGKISKEELTAVMKKMYPSEHERPETFEGYDADGDGKITLAEFKKAMGPNAEKIDTWFQHVVEFCMLDGDADQSVTKEEYDAAKGSDAEPNLLDKHYDLMVSEFFAAVDTDEDGQLTKDELTKAIGKDDSDIEEVDTDGDGKLSKAEMKAALKKSMTDSGVERDESEPEKPVEDK